MGIANREYDASEQLELVKASGPTVTGTALPLLLAPRPMTIVAAKAVGYGLSGAPTGQLGIQRFVAGAGLTTIPVGAALTHVAMGTSGPQTFSLPAGGSSQLLMQANDVLVYTGGGTNAALSSALIEVVVKNTQDIKSWF